MLVPTLWFAADLEIQFTRSEKPSVGRLDGSGWIKDPVIQDMISELGSRPDGVALQSGLTMANTEAPAVSLFAGKQSFIGWPWHETTWRGSFMEIRERLAQDDAFYEGKIPEPLSWLLHNNVRYVLWLPRDNLDGNKRFRPIFERIHSRYYWHHLYGDDDTFQIGFWERIDDSRAR
jgi:uncharacterized membrane protein